MANPNLYKELEGLRQAAIKRQEKKDKTYYVYLEGICGTELIGSGTKEQCEQVKANKMQDWRPGYLWQVSIYDYEVKEYCYWD